MRGSYHLCALPGCDGIVRGKQPICGACWLRLAPSLRMAVLTNLHAPSGAEFRSALRAALDFLTGTRKASA